MKLRPGWMLLHALFLASVGLAWTIDQPLFDILNRWYNGPTPLNGELHQAILSLAMYGQMLGFVLSLVLILIFDVKHRGRALLLALMMVSAGIGCGVLKVCFGRQRPLESHGVTVVQGPTRGIKGSANQSFPSGHTSTAFAMSYGLSSFYPPGRVLFWSLAWGVGLNRVLTVRHYLTDVIAGAWFGLTLGAFLLRRRRLWSVIHSVDDWADPEQSAWRWPRFQKIVGEMLVRTIRHPAFLVSVTLLLYWSGNGLTGLWDRDEPRFATAAREMIARGDWVVPTFNGELRPDKPIFIYWLMGLAYQIFGDGPFAARFFSGLGGASAVLIVYQLGKQMFGHRVGLLAGWILALSPMLLVESKLATADGVLFFWLTCSLYLLWKVFADDSRWAALGLWAVLGGAMLTKGPVALAWVAIASACLCLFTREWRWLLRLRWVLGPTLFVLISLPWAIAVHLKTGGDFLSLALGHHVVNRSLSPLEGHRGIPGFYLLSLFGLMAPWAWVLPQAVRELWGRRDEKKILFLAAWAIGPMVMLELVQTKLVHYYLPAYSAIAILLATAIIGLRPGKLAIEQWTFPLSRLVTIVAVLAAMVLVTVEGTYFGSKIALPSAVITLLLAGGIFFGIRLVQAGRFPRAAVALAGTAISAILVANLMLLPNVHQERVIQKVAERLKQLKGKREIALWQYRDPSLIHHFGESIPVVDAMRDQPVLRDSLALAQEKGSFLCPMTEKDFRKASRDPHLELEMVEKIHNWDPTRMRNMQILLVEVRPSPIAPRLVELREAYSQILGDLDEVVLPMRPHSKEEERNQQRTYPLNPAFLPSDGQLLR